MKSLLSRKFKCLNCGSGFKTKTDKSGKKYYVCSKYDNTSECVRVAFYENEIVDLIGKRYEIRLGRSLEIEEIREKVDIITVRSKYEFSIKLHDFDDPIEFAKNKIIF